MKNLFFLLILAFLTASCNKDVLYSEMHRDLTDNRWIEGNGETFEFNVEEDTQASIIVKFSHVYEPQYDKVPITVHVKKPDGQEEVLNAEMVLKDATGKDISDCLGDICDLDYVVSENYSFTKGVYTITITNRIDGIYLPNVLGVGLKIGIND